jgi:hypothetical protein
MDCCFSSEGFPSPTPPHKGEGLTALIRFVFTARPPQAETLLWAQQGPQASPSPLWGSEGRVETSGSTPKVGDRTAA